MSTLRARFKRISQVAAGAALLGASVGTAMYNASQADAEPLTCREIGQLNRHSERIAFYYAYPAASGPPPAAFTVGDDRLVGECVDGRCDISMDGCQRSVTWRYRTSLLRGTHYVARATAPKAIAGHIKAYTETTAGYHWLGGFKEMWGACTGSGDFTNLQCFRGINDLNSSWRLAAEPGCRCRGVSADRVGLKYGRCGGRGVGGTETCTVVLATDRPTPEDDHEMGLHDGNIDVDFPTDLGW